MEDNVRSCAEPPMHWPYYYNSSFLVFTQSCLLRYKRKQLLVKTYLKQILIQI